MSYFSSISQHGVFGFGQLLSTDDLQHQLLLHLARQRVLQVGVEGTCSEAKGSFTPTKMGQFITTILSSQWHLLEAPSSSIHLDI